MGAAPAESETHQVVMPRGKNAATWRTSQRSWKATAKDATTPKEKIKRGTAAHTTVHVAFSRNGRQQEADRKSAGACRRRGTRDRRGRRATAARPATAPAAGGRARRRTAATRKKEKDFAHERRLHTHAREPTRGGVWGTELQCCPPPERARTRAQASGGGRKFTRTTRSTGGHRGNEKSRTGHGRPAHGGKERQHSRRDSHAGKDGRAAVQLARQRSRGRETPARPRTV